MNTSKKSLSSFAILISLHVILFTGCAAAETVKIDYKNLLSTEGAVTLGTALAVSGISANTDLDYEIRQYYMEHFKSVRTDRTADWVEPIGDGVIPLAAFATALAAGELMGNCAAGGAFSEWGERSLRTAVTGGPLLLVFQKALGSGRPEEGGSKWNFFDDNNAASGHAFIGAIPFLTAAKMSDELYVKIPLYAASTVVGISRINDDDHYFSQAFLGWALAYMAASAVDETISGGGPDVRVFITPEPGGIFIGAGFGF